jgi:hypothetical protein
MVLPLRANCEIKYEWMNAQLMSLPKYPMSTSQYIKFKKNSVKISKTETFKYVLEKLLKIAIL